MAKERLKKVWIQGGDRGMRVFFNRPDKAWPRHILMQDLAESRQSIYIASAWFTDMDIVEAVLARQRVFKWIFFNRSDLNREGSGAVYDRVRRYADADSDCLLVIKVLGSNDWRQGVMHHKFVVIDHAIVWTGSYNFTYQARKNYETILRIQDDDVVAHFVNEVYSLNGAPAGMLCGSTCIECGQRSDERTITYEDSHGPICEECDTFTCVGCWKNYPHKFLNFTDSNGPRCRGCSGWVG
jgi:phosphatidylserine/phosphatidylglycerophosphate/cardiolipin synthase-like enzyme